MPDLWLPELLFGDVDGDFPSVPPLADEACPARSAAPTDWMLAVDPAHTDANTAWAEDAFEALRPHLADRQYLNNLSADEGRIACGLWGADQVEDRPASILTWCKRPG